MTIKEKLISLEVDLNNSKDIVEDVKKALNDAGENATKISNKLTVEGEKVVEAVVLKSDVKVKKKQVSRPKTIRDDEETKNKTNSEPGTEDNVKNKENVDGGQSDSSAAKSDSAEPFWSKSIDTGKSSIKISIQGKGKKNDSNLPANGRPLPQSTIEALKKKQQEENEKRRAKQAPQSNANNKQNSSNKPSQQNAGFGKGDKNNKFKQNPQNKTQGQKSPNFDGKNVKTTFNQGNASIAIGTNNKFVGKKKDKNKFNKDYEQKKPAQKGGKDKTNKYKSTIYNYDSDEKIRSGKRKTGAGAFVKPAPILDKPEDDIKSISLPEVISIKDFAAKLKMQPAIIVKKLFLTGKIVNLNTELTYEEAENIAIEYDILCEKEVKVDVIAELLKEDEELAENLVTRPPVVCVMGHVDHGKTSILDAIRNTNVISKEAGGITQHIGAYQVKVKNRLITFLDTPGHEAFTAMRLRGAKSTDIAVLVVAADDGVKPQTIEAINHAKAANVEIIVAVNKIDKPEANVDRVKQQLSEYDLVAADWGGQTTYCEVSAKQNIGIENLLEMILLTSDVMDLKANPNRNARGIVIESLLDKGKGPVARVLVQKGTLHVGDFVAMGQSFGKVRAMSDATGERLKDALPSTPVEILGLNDVPQAGDTFVCFDSEKEARTFAETFVSENKKKLVEDSKHKVTLDALFDQIKAGELKELNIVLKADVAGSSEAIKNSLEKLSNNEVVVKVIHEGVGNINESDVTLASASNAIIIGFNVKPEPNTKSIIEREKVDLRLYDIIYNAIDDVEKAMKGMLAPVFEEKVIGSVVVRQVFKASSVGMIAGCYVTDGEVRRNAKVRVIRNENKIFEGDILSLKRFKDEVKDVKAGFECGIVLDGFSDFAVEDTMEVYVVEEKKVNYD